MAVIRMDDLRKMSAKERADRLSDLRLELSKASNKSSQSRGKTKELKRAISRILTLNNSERKGLSKN